MAPYPEEIDVFTLPHSRMKELVDVYREKLMYTDFKDYAALKSLLQSLHHTFCEFKSHEQIENKYIMKKLKKRLKLLSIQDATVCNCHSDNKLSDMLALVEDGYSCTSKTEADRIQFGQRLREALQEFTGSFLPHMKEEEEVFQPMLMKYFEYEELKCLKQQVIKEHSKWHSYGSAQKKQISHLPREVLSHILSFLPPKDIVRCSKVCRKWYDVAREPALWRNLYPGAWARGVWENCEEFSYDRQGAHYLVGEEQLVVIEEIMMLGGMVEHLLPRVGIGVHKLVLSSCATLTTSMLQSFLKLCPNLSYLDVSYTSISDSAFKGSSLCKLRHLDVSGCRFLTDLGLFRLADGLSQPPSPCDPTPHYSYLDNSHRFRRLCEIEEAFCDASCYWQRDGLLCRLAKLSLQCPYMQTGGGGRGRKAPDTSAPRPPRLKYLSLSGCHHVTDDGLKCLESAGVLKELEFLDVSGCWLMSGEALSWVVGRMPLLTPDNLSYCDHIEDGPHPRTANGCQNLETGLRACCRLSE